MRMKRLFLCLLVIILAGTCFGQEAKRSALFRAIKARDSLLFELGYNRCVIPVFDSLIGDGFQFYHDEAGFTGSKEAFIAGVREGLCKLGYRAERVLDQGSLAVYPLMKNGVLYGAVQMGTHRFYANERDGKRRLTSRARFTNVWVLEAGSWKLKSSLSYDHRGR